MRHAVPPRSVLCTSGDHGRCPHWTSFGLRGFWRGRPVPEVWLCDCSCHAGCALAGLRRSRRETWDAQCRCPGAVPARASFARSESLRQEGARIMADVDLSGHPSADEVERRIRAAYLAHDQPLPPFGLTAVSRLASAASARRGTRRVRLLGVAARAVARGVRWSREPAAGPDADNRRELRRMFRAAGVLAGLSGALTGAAVASSGWRRVPCVLLATLSGLGALWTTAIATGLTQLERVVRDHSGGSGASEPRTPR